MASKTSFENKCTILSELWLEYKDDVEFADFIEYNDIGLPLAYMIANNIVDATELAENFINETFALLLAGLDLDEDAEYESLSDLLEDVEFEATTIQETLDGKNLPERFRDIANGE